MKNLLAFLFWVLVFGILAFGFPTLTIATGKANELFATASADGWSALDLEKKKGFLLVLAGEYFRQNPKCGDVRIDAKINEDTVLFFTTCLNLKKNPKEEKEI